MPNRQLNAAADSLPPIRRLVIAGIALGALIAAAWAVSAVYSNFAQHSRVLANLSLSLLGIGMVAAVWLALRLPGRPAPPSVIRLEPVDLRLPGADPQAVLRAVQRRLAFGSPAAGATGEALGAGNCGPVDGVELLPPTDAGPGLRLAWVHLLWEAGKRKEALDLLRRAAADGSESDQRRAAVLQQLMELEWAARRRTEGTPERARNEEIGI